MSWLLDTNVLSELRKGRRCDLNVRAWVEGVAEGTLYTSALVIGEIRRGVERIRRRDAGQAAVLEDWLERVRIEFAGRILEVDEQVAEAWGRLNVPNPVPVVDGLLAATARVRGFTLVTRNVTQVRGTGVPCVNPFDSPAA